MPEPGRLVTSMPMAMGTSSSGSNFFLMPKNRSTQEMRIIIRHFQLSPWVNWKNPVLVRKLLIASIQRTSA